VECVERVEEGGAMKHAVPAAGISAQLPGSQLRLEARIAVGSNSHLQCSLDKRVDDSFSGHTTPEKIMNGVSGALAIPLRAF
jgi:hypothetical protein